MTVLAIVAIVAMIITIAALELTEPKPVQKTAKRVEKHSQVEIIETIEEVTKNTANVRVYGGVRSNASTVHTVLVNAVTGEERNFFHFSNTPIKVVKSEILATLRAWA